MPLSDYSTAILTNAKPEKPEGKNRQRLAALLMIAGLAVIAFPFLTEVYGSFVQYRLNQAWEKQAIEQQRQAVQAEASQISRFGDRAVSTEDNVLQAAIGPLAKTETGDFPATKIKIPKIGVEQVVLKGVGPEVLKNGPGHYPGTPSPGGRGNVAIAGHRVTYTHPFNRLDELNPGDKVILETLTSIYEYRIVSAKTLDPNDLSALKPTTDARLTLTTCTPKYSARSRLDVQAVLVKVDPRRQPTFFRRLVGRIAGPATTGVPRNVLELAVSQGQEGVAQNPNDPEARIYLGTIYRNIGRYDDAVAQLKKAAELDPRRPQSYYELSVVYEKMGRTAEAINELNTAIAQAPEFETAYYRLGTLYLNANQADKAVEILKKSLALSPFSADTHYYLGQAYEQQGAMDPAKQEYEEAVRFIPDFLEAKAALRRLNR